MAKQREYEQQAGNIRYVCPACNQPAIQPITLPLRDTVCLNTQRIVTAEQIKAAPQLEMKEPKQHAGQGET